VGSAIVRLLGSRDRIPPEARMSLEVLCVVQVEVSASG
jgi:hypothetical protein